MKHLRLVARLHSAETHDRHVWTC